MWQTDALINVSQLIAHMVTTQPENAYTSAQIHPSLTQITWQECAWVFVITKQLGGMLRIKLEFVLLNVLIYRMEISYQDIV